MQLFGGFVLAVAAAFASPTAFGQDFCVNLNPPPSVASAGTSETSTSDIGQRRSRAPKSAFYLNTSKLEFDDDFYNITDFDYEGPVSANIIGGTPLPPKSWPFLGALLVSGDTLRYNGQYWDLVCGATLIHRQFILTAAHCFVDGDEYSWRFLDASSYSVRIGDYDLVKHNVPSAVTLRIVSYKAHPQFSYDTVEAGYDIAVAKLERPVDFNDWVQPACLPPVNAAIPRYNAPCLVAGWGSINKEGNRLSAYPRIATLPASSSTNCYDSLEIPLSAHDGRLFCAGDPTGQKDSCAGDSGGPTFCQKESGDWELSGIVSFGGDSCADANVPGAYTTISYHRDWVLSAMRLLGAVMPRSTLPPPPQALALTSLTPARQWRPTLSRWSSYTTALPQQSGRTTKTDAALLDLLQVLLSSMSGRIAVQQRRGQTTIEAPTAYGDEQMP